MHRHHSLDEALAANLDFRITRIDAVANRLDSRVPDAMASNRAIPL